MATTRNARQRRRFFRRRCAVCLKSQAAGSAADASSSTAAVEAASGALIAGSSPVPTVEAEAWVRHAVTPTVLAQIGRDLIRSGDSMHAIRVDGDGVVSLIPCSSWHFEGNHDPTTWTVRATAYGPSNVNDLEPARVGGGVRPLGIRRPANRTLAPGPLIVGRIRPHDCKAKPSGSLADDEAGGPVGPAARPYLKTAAPTVITTRSKCSRPI